MSAIDDIGPSPPGLPYREGLNRDRTPTTFAASVAVVDLFHRYNRNARSDGGAEMGPLSISIPANTINCLVGPSGCGKSTLLRLIAGLEVPAAGHVLIDGLLASSPTHMVPAERRGIGMVFQDYALFPHLNVVQNIRIGLEKLDAKTARSEAEAALGRVGLSGSPRKYPNELSGGQQQRVALARALAPRPRIMLMDEPFSGLDRASRDAVREDTLAILRESGITALIVTHDPEEALRLGDQIILMRHGSVIQAGTPRDLFEHPVDLETARTFSELNVIPGIAHEGHFSTPIGTFVACNVPNSWQIGQPVLVCLRPQSIRVTRLSDPIPTGEFPASESSQFSAQGRIVQRRFLGETDHIEIAVEGLPQCLRVRVDAQIAFTIPEDVRVTVPETRALIFAARTAPETVRSADPGQPATAPYD